MEDEDPTSLAAQKNEIRELMRQKLVKGDSWYLIECKWFRSWKRYVGYDHWDTGVVGHHSYHPGPIDNSYLLKGDLRTLKTNLVEGVEYYSVPVEAWNKLIGWYGLASGQEPLKRFVVEQGFCFGYLKLEVYLLELQLSFGFRTDSIVKSFSCVDKLESLAVAMRNIYHISQDKRIRMWLRCMAHSFELVSNWDHTLQVARCYPGQLVIIECQGDDGTFPGPVRVVSNVSTCYTQPGKGASRSGNNSTNNSGAPQSSQRNTRDNRCIDQSSAQGAKPNAEPGLCGLVNIGNTCFMNSALQCMSNVPSLTEYMLSDRWKADLNTSNPLGKGGDIAQTYAKLMKEMWAGNQTHISPCEFKGAVGRHKHEFAGLQPQDSHELLAFLLDGLHEDLNRIQSKPYTAMTDANGRADKEVASEVWSDYIKRNDSVIVDTFHGLLKSTLVCPECEGVSVKFDPFGYLSLPLPVSKGRQIPVNFIPVDPWKKIRRMKVSVSFSGTIYDLCLSLSKQADVAPDKLVVADVYYSRIQRIFMPEESITCIMDRDEIYIYEVPVSASDNTLLIPVYMREDVFAFGTNSEPKTRLFGPPILVAVPRNGCSYNDLYQCVLSRMVRYVGVMDSVSDRWSPYSYDKDTDADTDSTDRSSDELMDAKDDPVINNSKPRSESFRLFTFRYVNLSANLDCEQITDDGSPLIFTHDHPYIVAQWKATAKDLYYDVERAWDSDTDESMEVEEFQRNKTIQLSDCIDLFTCKERLGENDLRFCPHCKKSQQATKKFDLWQLPQFLIVHLKRFSFTKACRNKLDMFVHFPIRGLDLQKWIINKEHVPAIYDLIAVTNHMGIMGGGHYTAFAKHKNGQWYHFDDSTVKPISEDKVLTQAGYVLVYQMRVRETTSEVVHGDAPSFYMDMD